MRVKSPRKNNIIKLDNDVARIDSDTLTHYVYGIDFYANIVNAIMQGCNSVRVRAYTEHPHPSRSVFKGVRTSKQMNLKMQQLYNIQRSYSLTRSSNLISSKYVDITSAISNSQASNILKSPDKASFFLPKKTLTKLVRTKDVESEGQKKLAASAIPTMLPNKGMRAKNARIAAIRSIYVDGKSPSKVQSAAFPSIGFTKSIQGIGGSSGSRSISRKKKISRSKIIKRKLSRSPKPKSSPLSSNVAKIFNARTVQVSPKNGQFQSRFTKTILRVPVKYSGFDFSLPIRKSYLRGLSKFYLSFEAINSKGVVVDRKTIRISHTKELDLYLRPRRAPEIQTGKSIVGINQLVISQNDPKATGVLLYRREISPFSPTTGSRFRFLKKVELSYDDRTINYRDSVNNSKRFIYRAFAVGEGNRRSRRFDDVVTPAVMVNDRTQRHVSIRARIVEDIVRVQVTNFPAGAIAARVDVVDMTTRSKKESIGRDVDEQLQAVSDDTDELSFDHTTVKDNHIYEYTAVAIFPDGKEILGPVPVIQSFSRNIENNNIVIDASAPSVGFSDIGSPTIKFEISSTFTTQGVSSLISSLKSAGIDTQFTDDISKNRSKLDSLIAFEVIRKDITSGLTESFGVLQVDEFEDSPMSRIESGVSDVIPGREYEYVVTALIRNPSTLFSQTQNESADVTTAGEFSRKSFKFLNPLVEKSGTIPSTARSLGISTRSGLVTENEFLQGKTAATKTIEVVVPDAVAGPGNVEITKLSNDRVKLSWSVAGNTSRIDHFLIMAKIGPVKSILGAVANPGENGDFEYIDDELTVELDEIQYSVVPVFEDFRYGKESDSVSSVKKSEVPDFFFGV